MLIISPFGYNFNDFKIDDVIKNVLSKSITSHPPQARTGGQVVGISPPAPLVNRYHPGANLRSDFIVRLVMGMIKPVLRCHDVVPSSM